MARTVTGRRDVITLDGAYHGNSQTRHRREPVQVSTGRAVVVGSPTYTRYRCPIPTAVCTADRRAEAGRAYAREVGRRARRDRPSKVAGSCGVHRRGDHELRRTDRAAAGVPRRRVRRGATRPAASASPTRCRSASAASGDTFWGVRDAGGRCPTSSRWASRSETATRWRGRSRRPRSPRRSPTAWSTSTPSAETRCRARSGSPFCGEIDERAATGACAGGGRRAADGTSRARQPDRAVTPAGAACSSGSSWCAIARRANRRPRRRHTS